MEKKYNKKNETDEINYLELMLSGEFYNEKRIPGYNHLLGTLEGKPLTSRRGFEMPSPSIGTLK